MEEFLPFTQVNISQHLSILRKARLVDFVQEGATRCYYLSRPELVGGVLALLSMDHPVVRKTREQIDRRKKGSEEDPEGEARTRDFPDGPVPAPEDEGPLRDGPGR
jgi:ArsR family transcriptional regulator